MVGWWASKNKPQSPFKAQWCSMFNVQRFQQGDLDLLRINQNVPLVVITPVLLVSESTCYVFIIPSNTCRY